MSQPPTLAIETRDLRKEYGRKVAVSRLSLAVRRGSIFGFLGPNGAGKSTSIKMLLGLVKPTSGFARVLGAPAGDVETRRQIGFLPEHFRFYDWLTPAELLALHGRLSGLSRARVRERVPALLDLVGLTPHRDRRLGTFSKGMLQRAGLAQALIHEPALVFLDEPTSGLDPVGRRLVRDIIRGQRDRGATVFLNSHLLSEVEVTCDQVVFIREGEVVAARDLHAAGDDRIGVLARTGPLSDATVAGLAAWAGEVTRDGEELRLTARSADVLPAILRHLVGSGADVYAFTPVRTSLEDQFLRIVGEDRGL
ncbi:MAG TPA: ABC transporter ATP-binding protein [Vicinamibacterales bacterium]|nr:ABC transporter ATP-binding protein [Vicinamibacterales bacterium]